MGFFCGKKRTDEKARKACEKMEKEQTKDFIASAGHGLEDIIPLASDLLNEEIRSNVKLQLREFNFIIE